VDYAVLEPATRTEGPWRVFDSCRSGRSDIALAAVYQLLQRKTAKCFAGHAYTVERKGIFCGALQNCAAIGVRDLWSWRRPMRCSICPRDRAQEVGKVGNGSKSSAGRPSSKHANPAVWRLYRFAYTFLSFP